MSIQMASDVVDGSTDNPYPIGRRQTFSQRLDSFFTQNDEYDEHAVTQLYDNDKEDDEPISSPLASTSLGSITSTEFEFQWQFRHTISYWVSISFVCGSLLFITASFSWIFEDTLADTDFYVLVTVGYFVGNTCFTIGSYFGYYEVMNFELIYNDNNKQHKSVFCYISGTKSLNYWTVLIFLIGVLFYEVSLGLGVFGVVFDFGSIEWYLFIQIPIFLGGIFFFIGGLMQMHLNKAFKWRPTKLGWIVAWSNGIGGFFWFLGGIGGFIEDYWISFWLMVVPYLIGSVVYLIGSILSVLMWKLQQFGLVYLPHLNVEGEVRKNEKKKGMNNVLYRDVLFLFIYIVTFAAAITAIAYASLCVEYVDWIKNFSLNVISSIAILAIGSFMHSEPERAPLSYILWYVRVFFIWYTVNLVVDAYHISGSQCDYYGNVPGGMNGTR